MKVDFTFESFQAELLAILDYWRTKVYDERHCYFHPQLDNKNNPNDSEPLGAVFISRILWAFSAGYTYTNREMDRALADKAFGILKSKLLDPLHGGVYWSVHLNGDLIAPHKQIYAQAFAIYGLSAYYKITKHEQALKDAINLYEKVEAVGFDNKMGGYLEAFSSVWGPLDDVRLSAKDQNAQKTMNTNLHVLEAYTALYSIWPNTQLRAQLKRLVIDFLNYIYDAREQTLQLFMDENWHVSSSIRSFGHDIEGAWLLYEAALVVGEEALIAQVKEVTLSLAKASVAGLDDAGALWYEYDRTNKVFTKEKHWWVQAEAMVGFYQAYELGGGEPMKKYAERVWNYINGAIKDPIYGEWYWGRDERGNIMEKQDKAGFWKCPYHNSRCCMEMMNRLKS